LIVFRYLSREVLTTTFAVTAILMLIITSMHTIGYLADAAAGEISTSAVLELTASRAPFFLQIILPLGLMLGVLLVHGRLHLDNELVVLKSCGMSNWNLVQLTLGPAVFVAVIVGFVGIYLTPSGVYHYKKIIIEQQGRQDLEMLVPGSFQSHGSTGQVTYAREIDNKGQLRDVFVAAVDQDNQPYVLLASSAHQKQLNEQERFLIFEDGFRYSFPERNGVLEELSFQQYGLLLADSKLIRSISHLDSVPTIDLIGSDRADYIGRLHWRLSLPVIPLVLAVLAVPLSRTSPRQGRFARLIPGILIFQLYITLLMEARSIVEQGDAGAWIIWLIHIVGLLIASFTVKYEGLFSFIISKSPSIPKFRLSKAEK